MKIKEYKKKINENIEVTDVFDNVKEYATNKCLKNDNLLNNAEKIKRVKGWHVNGLIRRLSLTFGVLVIVGVSTVLMINSGLFSTKSESDNNSSLNNDYNESSNKNENSVPSNDISPSSPNEGKDDDIKIEKDTQINQVIEKYNSYLESNDSDVFVGESSSNTLSEYDIATIYDAVIAGKSEEEILNSSICAANSVDSLFVYNIINDLLNEDINDDGE